MRHSDGITATNGYQSHAEANTNSTRSDEGGGNFLALICGALCKDSPLAEAFGANDNINNNNAQPLMTPVQNGEQIARFHHHVDAIIWLIYNCVPKAFIFHGLRMCFCVVFIFIFNSFLSSKVDALVTISFSFYFSSTVTESHGFSKDICRSMVAMLDVDHSGKLGLDEFKSLLNDIAKWKVS